MSRHQIVFKLKDENGEIHSGRIKDKPEDQSPMPDLNIFRKNFELEGFEVLELELVTLQ